MLLFRQTEKKYGKSGWVWALLSIGILLTSALQGCAPNWAVTLAVPRGGDFVVNAEVLQDLSSFAREDGSVPLEQVLWTAGYYAIDQLILTEPAGTHQDFAWAITAEDAWWQRNGRVNITGKEYSVTGLEVQPPMLMKQVHAYITDIAPTASSALGIPAPAQATGQSLGEFRTTHVVLLFLDGFGYVRYREAMDADLIPNLAALSDPLVGLTCYPPSTRIGTAALLTGAPPQVSGVDDRSVRSTEVQTLFDVATNAGLKVVTVEGESLPFNLRSTEVQLSGDRDGNGSTDDNVLANALAVVDNAMPDLLLVHFHGIDDAGHSYGPGSPEEEATIHEVDAAVGQLLDALPADTLIIIFADHGMHRVAEEGRWGNHGNLIDRDMFIPIFLRVQ